MAATYRTLDHDEGYLSFEEVLQEEQSCIERCRTLRKEGNDKTSARFSLAFSGGGIRAAAFQAGVLWRLAEENKLKDVDYFSAVSGGGYITAAFASHCLAATDLPKSPEEVRVWYLEVVAKTLCRMQRNAGDFVRDCVSSPGIPEDGAGCTPRVLDVPILLATVLVTLVVLPFFFCVCILVPFAISIELFFGSAMRAAFCAPTSEKGTYYTILRQAAILLKWSPYRTIIIVLLCSFVVLLISFTLRKVLPACKLRKGMQAGKTVGRKRATRLYLIGYATESFLKRFIICLCVVVLLPHYTAATNAIAYPPAAARVFCIEYMQRLNEASSHIQGCAEYYEDGRDPWWKDANFTRRSHGKRHNDVADTKRLVQRVSHTHLFVRTTGVLGIAAVIGFLIAPVCGAELLKRVLFIAGPVLVFALTVEFTQFRVYGPVTRNAASTWLWHGFALWDSMVHYALLACIFLLPFLAEFRATFHHYYRRSLCENYFHDGEDVNMEDLTKNPYCPFILMTGTACDYKPPEEKDTISEISFSALHCGGEETGYVRMPFFRTLGTCTALTGAGCMDAISLTMSDLISLRFWLEVLNLTWGDYILFQPERSTFLVRLKWLGSKFETYVVPKLIRVPGYLPLNVVYIIFVFAWHQMLNGKCGQSRFLIQFAICISIVVLAASFYTFLPGCALLSMSPLIRRLHQLSMYFYRGNHPPQMLYVTDGGVKDCTSVLQLLDRRCERILLVLAAADPTDELAVLKTAMQTARSLKICNFYDPEDPRRDLDLAFLSFKVDKDIPYLHLGVSYCWAAKDGGPLTGHLFIVKNRLPSRCQRQPVRPLVREEEIRGKAVVREEDLPDDWRGMTTDQLGPFGCCDCCHTNGLNCGPKFPHGGFTGYLYLSPQWCNSLMRLGYEVSGEAIASTTSAELPASAWEAHVSRSAEDEVPPL